MTTEISKLAKEMQDDIKVIVLSIDNDKTRTKRLAHALNESIRNGSWIIVENAHLLTEWPKDVLKLLFVKLDLIILFQ